MFEAYAIGVTLKLNNLISAQLLTVSKEMERLDGLVISVARSLKTIGAERGALRTLAAGGNATATAMERASRGAANLERRLAALRVAGAVPLTPVLTPLPGAGGGRGGGGGGGGGGGHRGGGFHGGNVHMGPGGVGFSTVGLGAGSGAFVPLAVTAGMAWAGHSLYESAKDLNTEMQRFKLFGLTDQLNKEAFGFVHGLRVYGLTEAQNMKNFREAQGVFRESGLNDSSALDAAKIAAPVLGDIEFATSALDDESQAKMRTSSRGMLRWIEMSGGLKSASEFNRLANVGWRLIQTSGGTVDWEQLRQFRAIGGVAVSRMTEEAIAEAEPLISELKGGGAGTGLKTAFNRLAGIIRIPNQVAHHLVNQGIWDKSKVVFNSHGGIKQFVGNPFKSMDEFQQNQAEWYMKHIMPMYQRMKLSDPEMIREDAMLFGSTGGRYFGMVRQQHATMQRSLASYNLALPIADSKKAAKDSLSGQEGEFIAAWGDFKKEFGNTMLPAFSSMLRNGAAALRTIGEWMADHKELLGRLKIGSDNLGSGSLPVALVQNGGSMIQGVTNMISGLIHGTGVNGVKPGAGGQPVQVHTQVNMDGHKVASIVTRHQTKVAQMPLTAGTQFDPMMSPSPVLVR